MIAGPAARTMRIIAGIHRHRTLHGPQEDDRTTRPMLDRVKVALFDRLWALGVFPEPDAEGFITPQGHVLDLFAGVGQLGLEAISRGSDHVTFLEMGRRHRATLEENVALLEAAEQATVLGMDVLHGAWVNLVTHRPIRLVFCDPPYEMARDAARSAVLYDLLNRLPTWPGLVEDRAVLVLRVPDNAALPTLPNWAPAPEERAYGKMTLGFYQRG